MDFISLFKELIFANALSSLAFFVTSFALLGASIKYIDDAFDKGTFSKRNALLLAPFLGIFYAFLMSLHRTAATILLAFLLGVFLSGKINNRGFCIQLVFFAVFALIFDNIGISLVPLSLLTLASIIDEKGNDLSDSKRISNRFLNFWFAERFTMDFVALLLTFFRALELVFFISFLAFDFGYFVVGAYSKKKLKH